MSIDHAMTVARLAADLGVSLEEIGDAMSRLDDPVRNRTVT
jgi:ribosome biogenesis SPOUT family RNA methylase Rps3